MKKITVWLFLSFYLSTFSFLFFFSNSNKQTQPGMTQACYERSGKFHWTVSKVYFYAGLFWTSMGILFSFLAFAFFYLTRPESERIIPPQYSESTEIAMNKNVWEILKHKLKKQKTEIKERKTNENENDKNNEKLISMYNNFSSIFNLILPLLKPVLSLLQPWESNELHLKFYQSNLSLPLSFLAISISMNDNDYQFRKPHPTFFWFKKFGYCG